MTRSESGRQVGKGSSTQLLSWALFLTLILHAILVGAVESDQYATARQQMVNNQLARRGISDKISLQAMGTVPRHLFVPEKYRHRAYADSPLPIGYGQTISQPYIVAFMTEIVQPRPGKRILEIGTGSGYQAAILAATGAQVFSIEIIPELAERSSTLLKKLNYTNIKSKAADGYYGWPEAAPFDAIVVTAAAEFVPPPLLEQLKDGGRMVIPVGSPYFSQTLLLIEKQSGKTTSHSLFPVRFVPFRRAE